MTVHVSKLIKQGRELDMALMAYKGTYTPGLVSQMADALEDAQKLIISLRRGSGDLKLLRAIVENYSWSDK